MTTTTAETTVRQRKELTGIVVSDGLKHSIVVRVSSKHKHAMYQKYMMKRKKYMAHDEKGEGKIGDTVLIRECRPMSARKRFELVKVLKKGTGPAEELNL